MWIWMLCTTVMLGAVFSGYIAFMIIADVEKLEEKLDE